MEKNNLVSLKIQLKKIRKQYERCRVSRQLDLDMGYKWKM